MGFDASGLRRQVLVSDGDWRCELAVRGWTDRLQLAPVGLVRPEMIRDTAAAFLDAGADVLTTPTGAESARLFMSDAEPAQQRVDDAVKAWRACAAACRAAADEHSAEGRHVFGVIGPAGRLMKLGELREDVFYEVCEAQAAALADGGAEAIVCTSFTEVDALRIAVEAASGSGLPVIGSMTFDCGAEWTETTMGVTPPQACEVLVEAGAAIVGCDCSGHPDSAGEVVTLLRKACALPIWAKVDAGTPELVEGRVVYSETPEAFAARFKTIVEAGANIIGGCRGTTAAHLAALTKAVRKFRKGG